MLRLLVWMLYSRRREGWGALCEGFLVRGKKLGSWSLLVLCISHGKFDFVSEIREGREIKSKCKEVLPSLL